MASRTVVGVVGGIDEVPVLRLRLHQTAATIGQLPGAAHRSQARQGFVSRFMAMFEKEKSNANLEVGTGDDVVRRNQAKIDQIFDRMQKKLDEQRQVAKDELTTLSPEEQEDVVTFWSSVGGFFTDLMNWLKNMFQNVMEKIRQGWRLIKDLIPNLARFKYVPNFKSIG